MQYKSMITIFRINNEILVVKAASFRNKQ